MRIAENASLQRDQVLSIEFPPEGKLRSRKVISRSNARPTGKYPAWKMGRMVHWESSHELNAFRLLDANPAVVGFKEQPLLVHFVLNGEVHCHYPDVLVNFSTREELWEIKPACEATDPEVAARTRLLQAELPKMGYSYHMVIGEDLARKPRLSNVLTLLKFGRQPISPVEREQARRTFAAVGSIRWGSATGYPFGIRGRFILARLVLEGFLVLDFEAPLRPETVFMPAPSPFMVN